MASVVQLGKEATEKGKKKIERLKRVDFVRNGQRFYFHLGRVGMASANTFREHLEHLLSARVTGGPIPRNTLLWLAERDEKTHGRLVKLGLAEPRTPLQAPPDSSLGAFLYRWIGSISVKPGTSTTYHQTKRVLIEHFGADRRLRDIDSLGGKEWRKWMEGKGLAQATIARRVKCARQAFREAVRCKLADSNPFADVKAGPQSNSSRHFFVTRDMASKVLSACPDDEWKLIFSLARFGGLRCPSELLPLTWADVNREKGWIVVKSPKTEGRAGRELRHVPIFPELRSLLLQAFNEAPPGSTYVITRHRHLNKNLRTQLQRIIVRAGLEPLASTLQQFAFYARDGANK